jgi:hypothetical protein
MKPAPSCQRDQAEEAPPSLSERIARFAMAINGCSAQDVSKSYWKQAKRELAGELGHGSERVSA